MPPKTEQEKEYLTPIVPIQNNVIYPFTEVLLTLENTALLETVNEKTLKNNYLLFVMQKNPSQKSSPENIYDIGTMTEIQRVIKNDGVVNILIKGIFRTKISNITKTDPFLFGSSGHLPVNTETDDETTALNRHLKHEIKRAVSLGKAIDFMVFMNLISDLTPIEFAYKLAAILDLKPEQKQGLLEAQSLKQIFSKENEFLAKEIQLLEIEKNISIKTQEKFDKTAKDAILRERLQTIEKELGQEGELNETEQLLKKVERLNMPLEIEAKTKNEINKLKTIPSFNPEYSYIRTYVDWLVSLPWSKISESDVDLTTAKKILNADHYGLENIKKRILEYLAVIELKKKTGEKLAFPNILCFVGPPGVGKTSIGKSIARALNRNFISVSLGGIRDEAEIRGHRRTYVGAMPGKIIQGLKTAGTKNPVFMMDEIDKIGVSFMGDPGAALLEVLDPEQNKIFFDNYLDVPFDLSQVFFITTCNQLDTIPHALRDRLEIIEFSGYSDDEKLNIAKSFLVPKQIKLSGLSNYHIIITDQAIKKIISSYTKEAGVRNLEREIAAIMRKIAVEIIENKKTHLKITSEELFNYLGVTKFDLKSQRWNQIGVAPALAWTEAGGEVLTIEVAIMPGSGELMLTGKLGEVMKESCNAAMSYIRSKAENLGLKKDFYKSLDIHVHVPEGAIKKDGPSAGVSIAVALLSALANKKIKKNLGITGEITLRGNIIEVGGIREKILAAHRMGLTRILLPKNNEKDLSELPENIKRKLNFIFVDNISQAFEAAFE